MNFMDDGSGFTLGLQYRDSPEDTATTERNRKILLDAFDKLATGDVDGFWSIYDPDVVFYEAPCLPYGGAHKGLKAVQAAVEKLLSYYASMHTVIERVLFAHDMALLYQTLTFRTKATGSTGTLPVAELYRFRNGKVIEWRALYFDSNAVAQAIKGT